MMGKAILAAALICAAGCPAGVVRADFILSGSDHLDVNSNHTTGTLFGSSTANVSLGGQITYAYVNDSALLTVKPGGLVSEAVAYDIGRIAIAGGSADKLFAHGGGKVEVAGGSVTDLSADGTGIVNIYLGTISGMLNLQDGSTASISGGTVGDVRLYHHSRVEQSGGDVTSLEANDESVVDLSGGSVSSLYALGESSITLHGRDFQAEDGLALAQFGLIDGVPQYEVVGTGTLSGQWRDGTAWMMTISENDAGATIQAIPEPASLSLLALAGLAVLRRRRGRPITTVTY